MFIATTLLALTLGAGGPTPRAHAATDSLPRANCVAPDRTGSFRITATKTDGKHGAVALLLLENINNCLEVTFITDDRGPAAIDHLSLSGDTLRGKLNMPGAPADVIVRFNGPSVAGSIIQAKQEWRIEGRKTS